MAFERQLGTYVHWRTVFTVTMILKSPDRILFERRCGRERGRGRGRFNNFDDIACVFTRKAGGLTTYIHIGSEKPHEMQTVL